MYSFHTKTVLIYPESVRRATMSSLLNIVKQYQCCTHFKPKLSGVNKVEGNGVVREKRERQCGEDRGVVRVKGMLQEFWKIDMFLETFRLLACAISNFV